MKEFLRLRPTVKIGGVVEQMTSSLKKHRQALIALLPKDLPPALKSIRKAHSQAIEQVKQDCKCCKYIFPSVEQWIAFLIFKSY